MNRTIRRAGKSRGMLLSSCFITDLTWLSCHTLYKKLENCYLYDCKLRIYVYPHFLFVELNAISVMKLTFVKSKIKNFNFGAKPDKLPWNLEIFRLSASLVRQSRFFTWNLASLVTAFLCFRGATNHWQIKFWQILLNIVSINWF